MSRARLAVVGGGMGAPGLLTGEALEFIAAGARVLAPPRLCESLSAAFPGLQASSLGEIRAALSEREEDTVVVVSGDTGFYSLSKTLAREFGDRYRITFHSGISSLSYFCARLGTGYEDAAVLSLHGRPQEKSRLAGMASYCSKVFLLTGGGEELPGLLGELSALGIADLRVAVGENLSAPGERIRRGKPGELAGLEFGGPAVALVENPSPANPDRRLRDGDFLRGGTPMTKEAVRALAVSRLVLSHRDIVWDVGAGTGSVSVALAFRAREGVVYALDRDGEALELVRENRRRLGAYNVIPCLGDAPGALEGLPAPDAVFVGGSGGHMEQVLRMAREKNPRVRVCAAAITLETLQEAQRCLEGFRDVEITCVQASHSHLAGRYHLMKADNPVYLLSGRGDPV